ncbi:MAG: hypothetical protein ACRD5G_02760 [Candidatus Acidiferrales bacterium]
METTFKRISSVRFLLLIAALVAPAIAGAQVQTLDFPGGSATFANDINDAGQMVGTYFDANGVSHGFLYEPWKVEPFTPINYPGADWTEVSGINRQGDIVGFYGHNTESFFHGFVRTASGTFTSFDREGRWNTMPQAIAASGLIVGCIHNPGAMFGWLRQNGAFASETRGDGWTGDAMYTSVNDAGTLVGWQRSRSASAPGITSFLIMGTGRTDFEYPGASRTQAWGLNSGGDVVGWYGPAASSRGFLLRGGQFVQIHVPDAVWTRAFGINADGDIVGAYRDGSGIHGFLLPAE